MSSRRPPRKRPVARFTHVETCRPITSIDRNHPGLGSGRTPLPVNDRLEDGAPIPPK